MIGAYLKDTLTLVRHGVRDAFGTEGATTEESVRGLVEWKTRLMKTTNGEEVLCSGYVLMRYDSTVTHEDRLKISGIERQIVAVEVARDFSVRGMKVYVR